MGKLLTLLSCRKGGAEPSFVPSDIAGLALWLDAQDASTFTFSTGSDVSQWADKSGNANHAVQASGSSQPLYVASAINAHPAIQFADDGTAKQISVPDAATLNYTSFECFAVIQRAIDSGTNEMVLGKWSESSPSAQREFRFLITSGDALQCLSSISGTSTSGTATVATPSALAISTAYIAEGRFSSGTLSARVNNNIAGSASTASIFNGTSPIHLGARDGGSLKFNGYIGELLFYTSALSAGDRTQVVEYLAAKWGVTLA